MKREGIHKPTIEDAIEASGIETLHPGGFELTKRTAEMAGLKQNMHILDVSCGRGTQSIFYARNYGVKVTGLDISEEMIRESKKNSEAAGTGKNTVFVPGDSQKLPFADNTFDAVINECAVGIPDDSQKVLDEMVRVLKPGGSIVIHESIWKKTLAAQEKEDLSERYGTTPLELAEWRNMLENAGASSIVSEHEEWSKPERFWKIRKERDVPHYSKVLTLPERLSTFTRIMKKYGLSGVFKTMQNEKVFYQAVLAGKIGYGIIRGIK